jgi:MFS transporter, YNFM family, putative membrane transport protein
MQPEIKGEGGVGSRRATLIALFITGFGTFITLYVTQPLLPEFRHLFGASEVLVSLTVSATVLAVALTAPLVGLLSDSLGRKSVIVVCMVCLAIPTALISTSSSLVQIIIWRFLEGLFIPGIIAVAIAYIAEESAGMVGSTMGIYVTGTIVGGFAGRFITGILASWWGWRMAFVLLGLISLGSAVATMCLLPASRRFVRQRHASKALGSIAGHIRNPELLATYAVGFNVLFCLVGAFTYINFYLADKPFFLGPAALALIFLVYIIGIVMTPVVGHAIDRVGQRKVLVMAVVVAALGMLATLIRWLPVIVAGVALEASGAFACQSAASSHVGKAAKEGRSSAAGLYVSFYYFGGFVGSILPGLGWKHAGWPGCVAIILCVQTLTAFMGAKLWRDE